MAFGLILNYMHKPNKEISRTLRGILAFSPAFCFNSGVPPRGTAAILVLCLGSFLSAAAEAAVLQPGIPIDYAPLAFQPKVWAEKKQSTQMLPWEGTNIVFLTTPGDYDAKLMARWVQRLDAGWEQYADLTGAKPRPFKQINGKTTIAAVPGFEYTCGAGCGYVGSGGIELAMFYKWNYPALLKNPEAMPHYVFYEMGRNYYTFGDRHSCFITGFAVFMRYVCMDTLQCQDEDKKTRAAIEKAESLFKESGLSFLKTFTNVDGLSEKEPRLKDASGKALNPSDQPVTYASAMLRLYRENSGNDWLRRFFQALAQCPKASPKDRAGALQQSWNWYVSASLAAHKDLSPIFVDEWRLPLAAKTIEALRALDWNNSSLAPSSVAEKVKPTWHAQAQ
jgi:hypothetical protein